MKKFLLSLGVAAMALSANADNWFISGGFQGWSHADANYQFQETEPGVYTLTLTDDLFGEFLIVGGEVGEPNWDTKIGTNGDEVVVNEEYYYVAGANNFTMDGTVSNAVLTLNTNEEYLLVSGQAAANEYTELYLVGDINGSGWNEGLADFPLAATNGDNIAFSGTYTFTTDANYIKIKAGNVLYAGVSEDGDVILDGPSATALKLVKGGNTYAVPAGTYTITVNLPYNGDAGTIVFGGESAINAVEADNAVAPVYYNLQGVRVDNAANGLYIVVRGDKAAKEIVR